LRRGDPDDRPSGGGPEPSGFGHHPRLARPGRRVDDRDALAVGQHRQHSRGLIGSQPRTFGMMILSFLRGSGQRVLEPRQAVCPLAGQLFTVGDPRPLFLFITIPCALLPALLIGIFGQRQRARVLSRRRCPAGLLDAVRVYEDGEVSMKHPRTRPEAEQASGSGHRQDMVKHAAMIYASVLGNCGWLGCLSCAWPAVTRASRGGRVTVRSRPRAWGAAFRHRPAPIGSISAAVVATKAA
jgi:hypothetical protein